MEDQRSASSSAEVLASLKADAKGQLISPSQASLCYKVIGPLHIDSIPERRRLLKATGRYIAASMNGIVRLDIARSDLSGVYTDRLSDCIGIVLYNEFAGKLSLIHKSVRLDMAAITKELDWAGKDESRVYVFYNANSFVMSGLERIYTGLLHAKKTSVAFVSAGAKLPTLVEIENSMARGENGQVIFHKNGTYDTSGRCVELYAPIQLREDMNDLADICCIHKLITTVEPDLQYDEGTPQYPSKFLFDENILRTLQKLPQSKRPAWVSRACENFIANSHQLLKPEEALDNNLPLPIQPAEHSWNTSDSRQFTITKINNEGSQLLRDGDKLSGQAKKDAYMTAVEKFRKVEAYWRMQKGHNTQLLTSVFNLGTALLRVGQESGEAEYMEKAEEYLQEAFTLGNGAKKYKERLQECREALLSFESLSVDPSVAAYHAKKSSTFFSKPQTSMPSAKTALSPIAKTWAEANRLLGKREAEKNKAQKKKIDAQLKKLLLGLQCDPEQISKAGLTLTEAFKHAAKLMELFPDEPSLTALRDNIAAAMSASSSSASRLSLSES